MKKLLQMGVVLSITFVMIWSAQAQTVEERLTALEAQVANVEQVSVQLFQLVSSLQPNLVTIINALATQQAEIAALQSADTQIQAVNTQQTDDIALFGDDVATLEDILNGVTRTGDTMTFSNMNLQVVSGTGTTDGAVNGLGNIIIGYDEDIFPFLGGGLPASNKTGSHNLIVGKGLNYSSFGSIVTGLDNVSAGNYSAVTGGNRNRASAEFASVSGGNFNHASGISASVTGGQSNDATSANASVSGGLTNTASELFSTVSGGMDNEAAGLHSSISGGYDNETSGQNSSISGGMGNEASANESSVNGGENNLASNSGSAVNGGQGNTASGVNSTVGGGSNRTASGTDSWGAGSLSEPN